MEHFPELTWIDFVRGVRPHDGRSGRPAEADSRADLEAHLASGCKACTATVGLWKQVHSIATGESGYGPPEDVVRLVRLEFAANHLRNTAEASLVFDTFSQPILAGVRSTAAAARQMVYEAEGLTVDLRFDRQPYSNKVHLIGQILDPERLRAKLGNFPVMLWTENGLPVAESSTNAFGEFHLEFEAQDGLRLSIQVAANKLIRIPLANLRPNTEVDRTGYGADAGNL